METGHRAFACEKMPGCLCQAMLGLTPFGPGQHGKPGQCGEMGGPWHSAWPKVLLTSCLHDKWMGNKKGDHLLKLMPLSGSVAMI